MRRSLALGLCAAALLAALAGAPAAGAHAILEGSSPQRGATLDASPRRIVLRFNEPVEANFGAVRVFDAAARRVDDGRSGHPGGRGDRLGVGLRPRLPEGTYVATYRVISADAHPVAGGLVFSVGAPGAAATPSVNDLLGDTSAGPVTQGAFGVARGLAYLATALILGGLVFVVAVWLPALRAAAGAGARWADGAAAAGARARALLLAAAAAGVVASAAGIVLQGATAGATSGWAALDPDVVADVLGTRFGWVWGLRGLAFAALGGTLALVVRGERARILEPVALGADGLAVAPVPRGAVFLVAGPAAFIALAPALSGHASVTSPVALLFALDVAHVVAMSVWIGGLAALLTVMPAATRRLDPSDRTRVLAATLLRFSPIALACVAALLATGTAQAVLHVGRWEALTDTAFGRAVVLKAALLAGLIALAAVHRRRTLPRLRSLAGRGATPGPTGHLARRVLRAELALAVVVLGVAAALVSYPPPESLAGGPFAGSAALGPLRLEATVDPARVGANELHVYLLRARDGAPFAGTRELRVSFALPAEDIGPLPARAREAGPGHYIVDAVQLVPRGDWRLRVTSRVSEFDRYDATLTVPVR